MRLWFWIAVMVAGSVAFTPPMQRTRIDGFNPFAQQQLSDDETDPTMNDCSWPNEC